MRRVVLLLSVTFLLFGNFSYADPTPKEHIRSPSEIISITGRIGEGRIYCDPPLKFPGKILNIKLENIMNQPEDACLWGSEIVPGTDNRECRVWVEFCGSLGKKAVGVFDVTVTYEK